MTEEVFGTIRFIPGKENGKYPYCHSLYIEEAGILIDPASDRDRLRQLRETSGVNRIWLSHWHEDHITDLDLFEDLPLGVAEADVLPLSDIEAYLDAYEMTGEMRESFRLRMLEHFHFKPRKPDFILKDGDTIDLGSVTVDVISTPGHTPGHTSLFFREPKVLFLGDYDLTPFGPWYGDRDSSIEDIIASVERLRQIPAAVWIACHETGLFEEEPGDLWDTYLGVIYKRDEKLLALLDTPKTLAQIADAGIVYGHPGTTRPMAVFGEIATMKKHLEWGLKKEIIQKEGEGYILC